MTPTLSFDWDRLLIVGADVLQKDDVSDCYGIPVDRLPNPPLHLWYEQSFLMWYLGIGADNARRRHSTIDIPVFEPR